MGFVSEVMSPLSHGMAWEDGFELKGKYIFFIIK